MKTLAIYLRISNDDENFGESASIQNQRNLIHEYIRCKNEFNNWKLMEFVDDGVSGTSFDRKGVQDMLNLCGKNIDAIIVKDFSRFSRNSIDIIEHLDYIFPFLGVRFISISDNYDSDTLNGITGGIDVAFTNLIYSYYSRDLSQKIKTAKCEKAKKGEYINAYPPFGYRKQKGNHNKLEVEKVSAKIVKRIFDMASDGKKTSEIARIFNSENLETSSCIKKKTGVTSNKNKNLQQKTMWQAYMVRKILQDERYLGRTVYGKKSVLEVGSKKSIVNPKNKWINIKNTHDPIVTEEVFYKAQKIIQKRSNHKQNLRKEYLLTGKIKCAICGYSLIRRNAEEAKFCCKTPKINPELSCFKEYIFEKDILLIIISYLNSLNKIILDKNFHKNLVLNDKTKDFLLLDNNKNIQKNKDLKYRLYDKYLGGTITHEQYLLSYKDIDSNSNKSDNNSDINTPNSNENLRNRILIKSFVDCIYVKNHQEIIIKCKFSNPNKNT